MFKYTRTAIDIIISDIKKFSTIFNYGSLIFTSAYFIYALVTKTGNFIANIILASLFVGYTIFYFITKSMEMKTAKKIVKRSYKWIKIVIKTFTLGAMIYGIYTATTNVTPISIILATLMIILYVLQILLELACEIVEDKKDLLVEAVAKDMEIVTRPVSAVGNFVKRIKGEEVVIEEKEPSRELKILEKRMAKNKLKKENMQK
ncbi:MAG: hypothetical protein E7180_05325 [Erysipelotrichaceae bacterium]|nr:hypothetical protein [Erysipelotrichaceae bacterium]